MDLKTRDLTLAACILTLALMHVLAFAPRALAAPGSEPPAGAPAPAPTGTPQQPPQPSPAARSVRQLSNERTRTTWAHAVEEVDIHLHPLAASRTIGRTHLLTEDGFPEVYVVLSTLTGSDGVEWVRVRVPGRPNGRVGWVTASALSQFRVTRWLIVITLHTRQLKAFYDGRLRLTAPVGVGKPSTPTPTGHFWIREIFKLSNPSNPYWPWAIGTSAYSRLTDWPGGGVVGIHGDFGEPQAIPGDPSHGCVRMHASDLERLVPHVQLGTPVDIKP